MTAKITDLITPRQAQEYMEFADRAIAGLSQLRRGVTADVLHLYPGDYLDERKAALQAKVDELRPIVEKDQEIEITRRLLPLDRNVQEARFFEDQESRQLKRGETMRGIQKEMSLLEERLTGCKKRLEKDGGECPPFNIDQALRTVNLSLTHVQRASTFYKDQQIEEKTQAMSTIESLRNKRAGWTVAGALSAIPVVPFAEAAAGPTGAVISYAALPITAFVVNNQRVNNARREAATQFSGARPKDSPSR